MDKVTIYRFRSYDIREDQIRTSRRWGTREAVKEIACGEVIEDSAIEVDATAIESDIPGMTVIGYDPERRTCFQQKVK